MGCCTTGCKEEFERFNFFVTHDDPWKHVAAQWQNCSCTSVFYLIYRIMVAAGFITILVMANATTYNNSGEYFIYLTNWSFLFLTLDIVIQMFLACFGYYRYRNTNGLIWKKAFTYMPWYLKMSWVITNIASCAAMLVTVAYWALLYVGGTPEANDFNVHATNSIYVFVNIWITAVPVRIYHVFHTWIYSTIYLVFSVIYQLGGGGGAIYPVLDWENPASAALYSIVLAYIGTTIVWCIYYGFYRLRLCIYEAMSRDDEEDKIGRTSSEVHDNPAYVTHM